MQKAKAVVRALAGSRLVQFLVLGGAVFALAPRPSAPSRVSLSRGYLDAVEAAEASRNGQPQLAPAQAQAVDQRAIEDEVLYREAQRLGLAEGDPLVRQHLIQKVLLLAEDLGGATRTPTEAELRRYFEANAARWSQPRRYHFIHVFAARREALAALALDEAAASPPAAGDAFPLSRDARLDEFQLAASFGDDFARALNSAPVGAWSEPLPSRYGWHRVKIVERREPSVPAFEEVRGQVALDYAVERRQAAVKAFLSRALERYRVDVDGQPVAPFEPKGRMGVRSEPSAEDG